MYEKSQFYKVKIKFINKIFKMKILIKYIPIFIKKKLTKNEIVILLAFMAFIINN